jgi:hypothetical protein
MTMVARMMMGGLSSGGGDPMALQALLAEDRARVAGTRTGVFGIERRSICSSRRYSCSEAATGLLYLLVAPRRSVGETISYQTEYAHEGAGEPDSK